MGFSGGGVRNPQYLAKYSSASHIEIRLAVNAIRFWRTIPIMVIGWNNSNMAAEVCKSNEVEKDEYEGISCHRVSRNGAHHRELWGSGRRGRRTAS